MILEVTQEALDLNYDGMIIETHIDQITHGWRSTTSNSDALKQILRI
jgi:chorismate mutase